MTLDLAHQAAADGDFERVLELAEQVLNTGAPCLELPEPELVAWILLLANIGATERALGLLPRVVSSVTQEQLQAVLLASQELSPGDEKPAPNADDDALFLDAERVVPQGAPPEQSLVTAFLEWFGGRRDLYARQWYDERRRRGGYTPIRHPFTAEVARAHLEGRVTVGQYLLYPDASVAFGVIDLDLSADAAAAFRAVHGNDVSFARHDSLRAYARRLLDTARALGLELFAEDSGGKGLHLWAFFAPRRPARAARLLLGQIVTGAGHQPADVQVELFPKQETLGPRGLSSLVKLPLGVHVQTLRRCPLLDDALEPIADPGAALRRLRRVEPALVDAILGRRLVPLPAPALESPPEAPALPTVSSPRSLAEVLRGLDVDGARVGAEAMLEGCAALRDLVRRAYDDHRLAAEEAKALIYTLGLLGPRGVLVQELLAVANASFKELERVHRGLPSSIGCRKLGALFASSPCSGCTMSERAQPYPTPTLFAVGEVAPAPPRHQPFAPWLNPGDDAVREPWDAVAIVLARIEQRLAALEGHPQAASAERHTTENDEAPDPRSDP